MRVQMFLANLLVSIILLIAMLTQSKFALSLDTQGYGSANGGSSATNLEPVLFSYFNGTDTEGWAMYLGSLQNPGNGGSGGGDGNGYLRTSLPSDSRTSYFVAPSQYHGDWSNFTELRFDMWSYGGTYYTSGYSMYGDVYLENNGKIAYLLLPRRPASDWESFFVALNETENWTFGGGATSVHEVLSNVTDFQIRAEFGVGADHTGLDRVEIYSFSKRTYLPLVTRR